MGLKNRNNNPFFRAKKVQWSVIIISIFVYISFYIPVPFYITMPGSAMELNSVVEVRDGYKEKGNFMLTTISMIPGTVPFFLYAQFAPYTEIIPKEYILAEDEDPDEYNQRQENVMKESQDNAIIAAFQYLDLPIELRDKGILVMGLILGLPGEKVLQVGDLIVEIDKKPMKRVDDLLAYLEDKKVGELVEFAFIREDRKLIAKVRLAALDLTNQENASEQPSKRVGIGFYPQDERKVIPSKEVVFHTEEIGGPSAGLMFTLEIINQLTAEDLTKGYQVAGTGTITTDGTIGQIGGARLKVKAAFEQGAEIFFVPKDIQKDDVNQKEAEQTNLELGNPLKIIPVQNLSEAVEFLKQLPEKHS